MQSGLVRWWSSVQAQVLQGDVFRAHRPFRCKFYSSAARFLLLVHLSWSHSSHTCLCCVPSSLCFPLSSLSQMLSLPTLFPLFDPTFSPAFSRLLVPAERQLPGLRCLLFLALCSASPQMISLQLPCPVVYPFYTQIEEKRVSLIPSFQFQIWSHRNFWQDMKSGVCTRGRIFQVTWINFNQKQ